MFHFHSKWCHKKGKMGANVRCKLHTGKSVQTLMQFQLMWNCRGGNFALPMSNKVNGLKCSSSNVCKCSKIWHACMGVFYARTDKITTKGKWGQHYMSGLLNALVQWILINLYGPQWIDSMIVFCMHTDKIPMEATLHLPYHGKIPNWHTCLESFPTIPFTYKAWASMTLQMCPVLTKPGTCRQN